MLTPVEFNDDFLFKRNKIDNISFDRLLAAEFDASYLPISQVPPEQSFNLCAAVAQFTSKVLKWVSWSHVLPAELSLPSLDGRGLRGG
jgi:hypothetical protein